MYLCVGRKFRLGHKIGTGNNGEIYAGINSDTEEKIAIKLEMRKRSSRSHLNVEFQVYQALGQEGTCSAD
jgi:RIO-like serine/threonine protein kinase